MTAEAWVAIGIFVATALGGFLWKLHTDLTTIKDNHLRHLELYVKLILDHLGITYHEPKDR